MLSSQKKALRASLILSKGSWQMLLHQAPINISRYLLLVKAIEEGCDCREKLESTRGQRQMYKGIKAVDCESTRLWFSPECLPISKRTIRYVEIFLICLAFLINLQLSVNLLQQQICQDYRLKVMKSNYVLILHTHCRS